MHFDLLRDKARTLPKGADPLAVDSLRIWHCGYKSLDSIADFKNLQTLTVATFPDSSFDALSSLKKLRQLRVLHFPKIADLQPLAKLNLRSLCLETLPSWDASGKRSIVASLEPIAVMSGLAHLSLIGVVPKNRSLAALEHCKNLRTAKFHGYSRTEVARFYAVTGVSNAENPDLHLGM